MMANGDGLTDGRTDGEREPLKVFPPKVRPPLPSRGGQGGKSERSASRRRRPGHAHARGGRRTTEWWVHGAPGHVDTCFSGKDPKL